MCNGAVCTFSDYHWIHYHIPRHLKTYGEPINSLNLNCESVYQAPGWAQSEMQVLPEKSSLSSFQPVGFSSQAVWVSILALVLTSFETLHKLLNLLVLLFPHLQPKDITVPSRGVI